MFVFNFQELKAQYEVYNNMRNEANNCFEQALRIVPLSDEMLQRQFRGQLQERWNEMTERINEIQTAVRNNISSEDVPPNEKLNLLERELNELRITIEGFHGVLKTEEELELYVERLSILFERVCVIQVNINLSTRINKKLRLKLLNLQLLILVLWIIKNNFLFPGGIGKTGTFASS